MAERYGSVSGVRTLGIVPARSRKRCQCCRKRATHYGLGDGVVLIYGCRWLVELWRRDPSAPLRLMRSREVPSG